MAKKKTSRRREGKRAKRERLSRVVDELHKLYPAATTSLDWSDPLQLLVATVLSAQCTDVRVNMVTPALFERCPDARAYTEIEQEDLEELIRSTGFYRNKAKNIRGLARALIEEHDGLVPGEMDELVRLPGVGRKTANVILGNAFGIPAIAVDTHVTRLSGRLDFSKETDPNKIERDLMDLCPESEWTFLSHGLILHGRVVCQARKPRCPSCTLDALCPWENKVVAS